MKTILAPIDFSDATPAVTQALVPLARAVQAQVYLLHVTPPDPDFVGYDVGPSVVREQVATKFRKEHRLLQDLQHRLAGEGVQVSALLIQGPTVAKILDECLRLKADLIVMGSHGHGSLHNLLVGSVTEGVMRQAACPVMIVPRAATQPA